MTASSLLSLRCSPRLQFPTVLHFSNLFGQETFSKLDDVEKIIQDSDPASIIIASFSNDLSPEQVKANNI